MMTDNRDLKVTTMRAVCWVCVIFVMFILPLPLCSATRVIIVEDAKVCFKRTLPGKRVSRAFVRKIVSCERVEDCHQECTEEKKFVCEGFNYRLDSTRLGRGDCELIDLPLGLLDPHKDIITNPYYDYYEKDRNTYQRCKDRDMPYKPPQSYPQTYPSSSGGLHFDQGSYEYGGGYRETNRHDNYPRRDPPRPGFVFRLPSGGGSGSDFPPYNRRSDPYHINGDKHHTYTHTQIDNDYKSYLPPPNKIDFTKYYGKNDDWRQSGYDYSTYGRGKSHPANIHYNNDKLRPVHTNYLPLPFNDNKKHWGEYGGTYGGGYGSSDYGSNGYLPPKIPKDYLPPVLPPAKHHKQPYNINECSLRSATGYRLYKKVVKKILTVSSIYDCEMACFKEIDFVCTSYAFRYIIGSGIPPNNCYLSDRNYKELDYYTDLEQDRNFDIYTMHNKDRCEGFTPYKEVSSECFLHVRSGQRLDDTCVRDSLFVTSFLDCQLECLKSKRFLCRSFTYRYGSAVIGSVSENCQLSDVPFRELDPHRDLIPDPGFVLYERASYGHGCELDHVNDQYLPKQPSITSESDKLCYIGYGWPAKLLRSAVRKTLHVQTEEECRAECTRFRMETQFCCMSFSYSSTFRNEPNCFLSDIFQRDLLETVDFVKDQDFWLFSWDTSNPQCKFPDYYEQKIPFEDRNEISLGGITWRIYSVGGWPCKKGTLCKQSALGFWFCELEGGSPGTWDYCCRPGHQCGYSEGYAYQWCYVGPSYTQWRKCNDKYYPYLPPLHVRTPLLPKPPTTYHTQEDIPPTSILLDHDTKPPTISTTIYHTLPPSTSTDPHIPPPTIFLEEPKKTYLPPSHREPRPWQTSGKPLPPHLNPPYRLGFRPDRPTAPPIEEQPKPSLNEYENHFNNLFLEPPKPGGFGQARHWPVSYLHKEGPPNATISFQEMKEGRESKLEPKYEAIKNLIDVIKSNDLDNIKYQITNDSNKPDDVLHVQIPLPSNFSEILEKEKVNNQIGNVNEKLLPPKLNGKVEENVIKIKNNTMENVKLTRSLPVYRRSYIVKTNKTDARRWKFPENEFSSIR